MVIHNLSDKLNVGIKILTFCINDKKSIKEGCLKFNKEEKFLRRLRADADPKTEAEKKLKNEFIELYSSYLKNRVLEVHTEMCDELDKDLLPPSTVIDEESFSKSETGNNLELDFRGKEIIKTAEQLMEAAKVDLNLWKLDRQVANKWDVTMKGADGEPITAQNFQVKIWLSKKQEAVSTFNAVDVFKQLVNDIQVPQHKKVTYDKNLTKEKNLLEINIFDLHIGKLCWAGETGENYDVKIAAKRFNEALQKILVRSQGFAVERILFPIGNDFFNVDTLQNTTTHGTPQDEDLRWQKTFKIGFELLVNGIELMRQHAPVDIVMIPGNHDYMKNYFLGHSLASWYRDIDDVKINNHASPRKYYQYGEVLLGFTHGDNEKEANLPMMMMKENKKIIGNTTFHEWHLGHFHKKKTVRYQVLNEELGVTVRYLSSMSGTDSWHHRKGYVGGSKSAEAFLWNAETGFISQFNVNIIDDNSDPNA